MIPETLLDPFASQGIDFVPEPGKTALLIIDMQYLDAHPGYGVGRMAREMGYEQRMRYFFDQMPLVIANIQRLLEASRRAGVEVIHTMIASLTRDCRDASSSLRVRRLVVPFSSREAQVIEELRPAENEIVLPKTSSGVFNSTAIDQVLRNLGIEYLIVTGVVTDHCVELSARDAADRGYYVLVVSDACATFTERLQRSALKRMNLGLMRVKSTEEVLDLISAMAPKK